MYTQLRKCVNNVLRTLQTRVSCECEFYFFTKLGALLIVYGKVYLRLCFANSRCTHCKCCCFDEALHFEGKQEVSYVRIYNTVLVLAILICIIFFNSLRPLNSGSV